MSGNSCASALHTAPIVRDFCRWPGSAPVAASSTARPVPPRSRWPGWPSAGVERQLVLADLHLVGLLQALGLDPRAIDIGPVQRAAVVQVPSLAAPDQQRVIARHGDVVEEDLGVGRSPMLIRSPSTAKLSPTRPPPARITSAGPWAVTSSSVDRNELALSSIR